LDGPRECLPTNGQPARDLCFGVDEIAARRAVRAVGRSNFHFFLQQHGVPDDLPGVIEIYGQRCDRAWEINDGVGRSA
jgi:hypothetical protein